MSIKDSYLSLVKTSEGFYKEKGSKFIAYAFPCDNEVDAKVHLNQLWKDNHNACHVCFAWRFGVDETKYKERFSDDGEPSNSAGKPIFGQIQAYNVTNILIAVVRYYGGTNLGVGGLIGAYKTSSKDALESSDIIEGFISNYYIMKFEFSLTGTAMRLLKKARVTIIEQGYEGNLATVTFKLRTSKTKILIEEFESLHGFELKHLKTE
jgi:uncharacterized YigZ family protein